MFIEADKFFSFETFQAVFANQKNMVKKSFEREELLSVSLLEYLKEVNKVSALRTIECDFDTKNHLVSRWNDFVKNIDSLEISTVFRMLCDTWLEHIIDDNKTAIGAYEQFLSLVRVGDIPYHLTTFEYSPDNKKFIGFCFNGWKPQLMTYDFDMDKYLSVSYELVENVEVM